MGAWQLCSNHRIEAEVKPCRSIFFRKDMLTDFQKKAFQDHLGEIARRDPERVAFSLKTREGYRQITYREACKQTRGIALSLIALGLKPGARVAILSENRPEWALSYLGIWFAGGVVVPLDILISPAEWRRLLDDSETSIIFVSGRVLPKLKASIAGSIPQAEFICFDPPAGAGVAPKDLKSLVDWSLSSDPAPSLPVPKPSDIVEILYTSGTTGRPKGVMLTQENILSEIVASLTAIHVDEKDNVLCLLPLQHVFAFVDTVLCPLSVGAQVTFIDTLKRSEVLKALEETGITVLPTVPEFFYLLHRQIDDELAKKPPIARKLYRGLLAVNRFCQNVLHINLGRQVFGKIHRMFGSKLRLFVSGGSAFDSKVAREFFDLGFTILQGYGLTETTGACSTTRVDNNVLASVGPPLPGVDFSILAPDSAGEGEVLIRGPIVTPGYYRDPTGTADALKDGWLHSGDLGRLDAKGNLFITGRKKEIIVLSGGKKIYPDELETYYLQCPFIKEIAVLGISDPGQSGEHLHAIVVPNFDYLRIKKIANSKEILRDEIGRWSNGLPAYKRLMSYQIQKEPLLRTTTLKIKRLELKRLVESGELREVESAEIPETISPEDNELRESAVGQEVLVCLRDTFRQNRLIDLSMNLELDLGFDSIEKVELLASLERALNIELPEDFGAEIYTVRDLIAQLEQQATVVSAPGSGVPRQSWKWILSEESLDREGEWQIQFSGGALTLLKFLCLRFVYLGLRVLLGLEAQGVEYLPKTGPFLICPNHLSYLDPLVVTAVLPYRIFRKVFFVADSELFRDRYMRLLAPLANILPVDPDTHLVHAMKVSGYGLRKGHILCIFPEGARSFDGELKEFKKGSAILAGEIGVPIVPVGIRGTYQVWARDSRRIRLHKVKVVFGKPMAASGGEETVPYDVTTNRLREAVLKLIGKKVN